MNTSGNDVINHFIDSINDPGMLTKGELERLVNGEFITQKVDEMITYKELYSSNNFSALHLDCCDGHRNNSQHPTDNRQPHYQSDSHRTIPLPD